MTWTVKFRDRSGSLSELTVDAPTRGAALQEARRRGIAAISVSEGARGGAKAGSPKSPGVVRGVIAGLAVVAAGALALWFFMKPEPKPEEPPPKKPSLPVKTVKPAAPKPVAARPETNAVAPVRIEVPVVRGPRIAPCGTNELGFVTNAWGYIMDKVGPRPVYTNRMDLLTRRKSHDIFKNGTHRKMAFLYEVEPGEFLFGDSESFVGKDFEKRFLKSLQTPVTISPDDDAETRMLKEGVIATTQDLKEIYDKGGDVRQAMIDARRELQELGVYRMNLERQVREIMKDRTISGTELQDFVDAANVMLSERGVKPLSMPRTAFNRIKMLHDKSAAEAAANGATAR